MKIVAVDALPTELPYVEKGLAPGAARAVRPTSGATSASPRSSTRSIYKKDVPEIVSMDPVRVTNETLGSWARQLRQWGFPDVPEEYLKLK